MLYVIIGLLLVGLVVLVAFNSDSQPKPTPEPAPIEEELPDFSANAPLLDRVAWYAVHLGKFKAAMVQRKFGLGYRQVTAIIEQLQRRGVVGPMGADKQYMALCRGVDGMEQTLADFGVRIHALLQSPIIDKQFILGKLVGESHCLPVVDILHGVEFVEKSRKRPYYEAGIDTAYNKEPRFIAGWIYPELTKCVLVDAIGQTVGELQKGDFRKFVEWSGGVVMTFVGFISTIDNGNLSVNNVKIFRPVNREDVEQRMSEALHGYQTLEICKGLHFTEYVPSFFNEDDVPIASDESNNDEEMYDIAGINYRELDDSFLGDFTGTLMAELDNPHDKYAVAIYKDGRHIGYLPRGNRRVWSQALAHDGDMPCHGFIDKGRDETEGRDFYFGEVCV